MSSSFGKKVFEDSNGFIWICTQDGLNRFDGKNFQIYRKDAQSYYRMPGSDINAITEDTASKILWAITSSGGIAGISTISYKVVKTIYIPLGASGKVIWLRSMVFLAGKLWLGTDKGLYSYDPKTDKFTIFKFPQRVTEYINVEVLSGDGRSNLWIANDNGTLIVYDVLKNKIVTWDKHSFLKQKDVQYFLNFTQIYIKNPENALISTASDVYEVTLADNSFRIKKIILPGKTKAYYPLQSVTLIGNELWVATSKGIYTLNKAKRAALIADNDIGPGENVFRIVVDIFEDKQKNVWISLPNGVVMIPASHHKIESYYISADNKTRLNRCYSIFEYSSAIIYAGGDEGLYEINRNTGVISQPFSNTQVFGIDTLYNGMAIACGQDGIRVRVANNKWINASAIYNELAVISNSSVNRVLSIADTLVFFALETYAELYCWRPKKKTIERVNLEFNLNGFDAGLINELRYINKNELIILCDNAVYTYNLKSGQSKKFQFNDPATKKPIKYYFDIELCNNYFYLCTYENGIIELKKDFTFSKSLNSYAGVGIPGSYKVAAINDSILLVTTNNGLYRFNTKSKAGNGCSILYESSGLQTHQFEEGCAIWGKSGYIAGGLNGFQVIDTSLFNDSSKTYPFYMNISEITKKNGTKESFSLNPYDNNIFGPDVYSVVLNFSLPHYGDAAYTQYEYRIKTGEQNWIDNGGQQRILLTDLPPGKYSLQIRAKTTQLNWQYSNPIKIEFLPPWYRTKLFFALCTVLIGFIIFGIYKYRIHELHKEYRFKEKIAADLHDDLGSTINGIRILTEVGEQSGSAEYYTPVKKGLQEAAQSLREMIWVLDNKTNNASHIFEKLQSNTKLILYEKNINLILSIHPSLSRVSLKMDEKRDLYLILKEFINNSIKYADCTIIEINATTVSGKLNISIRDNGKGFDINRVIKGNGLHNIRQRAQRCNLSAEFISATGKGTLLLLKPL